VTTAPTVPDPDADPAGAVALPDPVTGAAATVPEPDATPDGAVAPPEPVTVVAPVDVTAAACAAIRAPDRADPCRYTSSMTPRKKADEPRCAPTMSFSVVGVFRTPPDCVAVATDVPSM
jgi:hypothetical protein